ncbi:hypothetical protein [Terracoccus luteus]|uniref:Uncharacterized protein n=1 Tax=Terracoccus luteus TaxID=53356 RepID=A0A839PTZ8_9MICO|nr:hypothetical protein [Terracoccus luteus]MBB2985505.1 hypothetical protein [Terracoccus luteus]MCP2171157.1 hypothetical protein [Terracoccus luteus]
MFVSLAGAAQQSTGFSVGALITLLVVAAVVYPLQKRLREKLSRERRARYLEEDRLAAERRDRESGVDPDGDGSV